MIRVCVIDDHPIVREGIKRIIAENPGMSVTAEAGSGREAVQLVQKKPCDVVVLDITMPDKSGLDVLKQLHATFPRLPVLILSVHGEDQYGVRVVHAGAAGYLTKESAPSRLVQAIRKVASGGKYLSNSVEEKLAFRRDESAAKAPHEILSDREYQVLCMIASGKTVTVIAEELHLSIKTISTYRTRILEKLNMRNSSELTRYAIKEGLVE